MLTSAAVDEGFEGLMIDGMRMEVSWVGIVGGLMIAGLVRGRGDG